MTYFAPIQGDGNVSTASAMCANCASDQEATEGMQEIHNLDPVIPCCICGLSQADFQKWGGA